MNIGDVASLAGFGTAAVFVVQFLRNLLGTKILNGSRTQAAAALVSCGFGYLAASSSREFQADEGDIAGSIIIVFMLAQTIYNMGFRDTEIERRFDSTVSKITDKVNGGGSDA